MSKLENCSMCSKPASFLCACSFDTFLCNEHHHIHMASDPTQHHLYSLQFLILPPDIEVLTNIKTALLSQTFEKVQKILGEREETLRPLLKKIEDIEKQAKKDIKRIWREATKKIEEIEEMLRTEEVGGI